MRPAHSTGKERDAESGNDYFGARYYASSMGRLLSPDPEEATPLHLLNPQRWNKYSYGLNNPTGGPFKPSFGLSGAVRLPDTIVPPFARALLLSIHIQSPLCPRSLSHAAESCSTPSLQAGRTSSRVNRIAMNIAQLLHKLTLVAHIEIVITFLPEMLRPRRSIAGTRPASTI